MKQIVARHIASALCAGGVAWYSVPLMSRIAQRLGILDNPDGRVKTHTGRIPYLGGLAIYVAFISALALFYPFHNSILWLLSGTTLLLFLGLMDDLLVFNPLQKSLGQCIATLCFLKGGVALKTEFFSEGFNVFMSAFWIVLLINAFNLIDVMDGLSSLTAILASLSFVGVALLEGNYHISLLLVTFVAPLCVFFWYNKPPAKIYLGDSGALFIGGFLAAIPLFFSWGSFSLYGYLVPLVILAVPLLEVGMLILIRTYYGIPFYRASPHHFSLILQKRGWSKNGVLLLVLTASLVLGISSLLFLARVFSPGLFLGMFLIFIVGWIIAISKSV